MTNTDVSSLADLFQSQDGRRVGAAADWPRRRRELLDLILDLEYGQLPPTPPSVASENLYVQKFVYFPGCQHFQYCLSIGGDAGVHFTVDVNVPPGPGPFPAIINGDGCWRYINDGVIQDVLNRGMILALFNRVEIVPDVGRSERTSAIHRLYPDGDFGAIAAWAWGYQRVVDFLTTLNVVDAGKIGVFGHSRGGKTSLLAGATDERIALTAANCSGCGGAGSFQSQGPGCETLADILKIYPYWFTPKLAQFVGRESSMPFDQHFVKALVAPRALLTNEALADLWANPAGTWTTHSAAKKVYELLGGPEKIGIHYREGDHDFSRADWGVFLDFAALQFRGEKPDRQFDVNPF